jgi:hypothetical protein
MQRTIDDYDSMTKREMIKAKQEKAQMYVHAVLPFNVLRSNGLCPLLIGEYKSSEQTM